jgi:zinc finger MYND domain-containing protein 10
MYPPGFLSVYSPPVNLTFGANPQLPILVQELIAIEVWKLKVLPYLRKSIPSTKAHMLVHHEANILNLLEIFLYHPHAVEALGETVVDLAEYCCCKMVFLTTRSAEGFYNAPSVEKIKAEATNPITPEQALEEMIVNTEFRMAIISLSIVRYFAENLHQAPIGVVTRLVQTHDCIGLLSRLMETKPWKLTQSDGTVRVFQQSEWKIVPANDRLKVSQVEGQIWLTLLQLLCAPEARSKLQLDGKRKETVASLRNYFSEVLLDQIPVLTSLFRAVEEIQMADTSNAEPVRAILVEQFPEIKSNLLEGRSRDDFKALARHFKNNYLQTASSESDMNRLMRMYNFEAMEELLDDPKCDKCGEAGMKRCSRCKHAWYCSRECQVEAWPTHQPICDVLCKSVEK